MPFSPQAFDPNLGLYKKPFSDSSKIQGEVKAEGDFKETVELLKTQGKVPEPQLEFKKLLAEHQTSEKKVENKGSMEFGIKSQIRKELGDLKPQEVSSEKKGKYPELNEPINKFQSNEAFVLHREMANRPFVKNESLNSFSKTFNVEKKDKKPGEVSTNQNIGHFVNNDKDLNGIIKNQETSSENLKFSSPKELFNWISKIISKNPIKDGQTLNLQIRDRNLGDFNISAQNGTKIGEINMAIVSQTKETDDFFKANEKDLVKSLEQAGVKIGKIEILNPQTAQSTNTDSGLDLGDNGSFSGNLNEHFAQRDQLERDGQRRREIWSRFEHLRER